jgi:hypothetical protein
MSFKPVSSAHSILTNRDVVLRTVVDTFRETNWKEVVEDFLGSPGRAEMSVRFSPEVYSALKDCPTELLEEAMLHPDWKHKVGIKEQSGNVMCLQRKDIPLLQCNSERKQVLREHCIGMVVGMTMGICYASFLCATMAMSMAMKPDLWTTMSQRTEAWIGGAIIALFLIACLASMLVSAVIVRWMRRSSGKAVGSDILEISMFEFI